MSDELREVVGRFLDDDAADAFVAGALRSAFTGPDGHVDEEKVAGNLLAIRLAGHPAGGRAGEGGRSALRKRHNVGGDGANQPAADGRIGPGANGRAALARRHGTKGGNR